jgi:hypothetical protein
MHQICIEKSMLELENLHQCSRLPPDILHIQHWNRCSSNCVPTLKETTCFQNIKQRPNHHVEIATTPGLKYPTAPL